MGRLQYRIINNCGEDDEYTTISLFYDNRKSLDITFGRNLDVYITLWKEEGEDNTFLITKENYKVYEIFERLYYRFQKCLYPLDSRINKEEILKKSIRRNIKYNEMLRKCEKDFEKDRKFYKTIMESVRVFQTGKIIWSSDDYAVDVAPYFQMEKVGEDFLITIDKPIPTRKYRLEERDLFREFSNIRFRMSGSRYRPFDLFFMLFYNELSALPIEEFEQIEIEEFLYEMKKKRKK